MYFAQPDTFFGGLAGERTAQIVATAADVVLVVGPDDSILDASFGVEALFNSGGREWVGRRLHDTVTPEALGKVESMLAEARGGASAIKPREINHAVPNASDMPVRYAAAKLDEDGNVVCFGRDISRLSALQQKLVASQLSLEREFARLKAGERRYRQIFNLSEAPKIILDADTLDVVDMNAAAERTVGHALSGKRLPVEALFAKGERQTLHALLRATLSDQLLDATELEMGDGQRVGVSAQPFHQGHSSYLLVHLRPSGSSDRPDLLSRRNWLDGICSLPDGFVVVDTRRKVLDANRAFVELVGATSLREVVGTPFDSYFERAGVDGAVLMSNVSDYGMVRRFATVLASPAGDTERVEVSGTLLNGEMGWAAFLLRSTIPSGVGDVAVVESASREQIMSLVGHVPLKDIVRETTTMIEDLCIQTALDLTKGNRVSAARMLGLSRQSLYAKLARNESPDPSF